MDKQEAQKVLEQYLGGYRSQGYTALLRLLLEPDCFDVEGSSGARYQIEISAVWDSKDLGDLRVMGAIDDGSFWRSVSPLGSDFIVRPDGTFVGE